MDFDHRVQRSSTTGTATRGAPTPGKRTLTEGLVMQRRASTAVPEAQHAESGTAASSPAALPAPATGGPRPTLQMLFGGPRAAATGSGDALPGSVQCKMERAFDADFSAVRVHEGHDAAGIGALAFTRGTDIHFAPGQYDPHGSRGQELLGHELAHVVQQSQGRVGATAQAKGAALNDDPALEHEADVMGARAARGEPVGGAAAPSTAGATGSSTVQCKKFQFAARDLDSSDVEDFRLYVTGIRNAHPARLVELQSYLTTNQGQIPSGELDVLIRIVKVAIAEGTGGGSVSLRDVRWDIPSVYHQMVAGLDEVREAVGAKYRGIREAIIAAGLIEVNATLISAGGGNARKVVLEITGAKPTSGFDNESANSIRQRAEVLKVAWQAADTEIGRLQLFMEGFGNDPCLAARLNGVTEYVAKSIGIDESALSDGKWNAQLGNQIADLAFTFKGNGAMDWNAFQNWLQTNHPNLTGHPDFPATWPQVKLAVL